MTVYLVHICGGGEPSVWAVCSTREKAAEAATLAKSMHEAGKPGVRVCCEPTVEEMEVDA